MANVEDADEAINMVKDRWRPGRDGEWNNFKTHKQGFTWVVTYTEHFMDGRKQHEVHINAKTGKLVTDK